MSAKCRCWCGCERLDRQLNDETSSVLTCMPCNLDRHKREAATVTVNLVVLERVIEGTGTDQDRRYLADKMYPIPGWSKWGLGA